MTPHPDSDRIVRAIRRCLSAGLVGPWTGDLYRYAAPRWATEAELLTGAGALHAGGRWHPIATFRAVYASLDPETALAESLAHCRRYGLELRDAMPKTGNAVVAHLQHTLDLTNGRIRQRLGLSEVRLLAERWWEHEVNDPEALTQAVGRIACEVGLEALLVSSAARKGGKGIVYFPDNKFTASTLRIVNPDELPRTFP
jgi:RES domain-containing protein